MRGIHSRLILQPIKQETGIVPCRPDQKQNKKNSIWKQILLFCSAFGVAYTAQFLFLILLVEGLDVNEYLAQFLGLFIYGGANFLANKKITFQ